MSDRFNVRISYKGEGELQCVLPVVGQISIWAGRDIFLKGAPQRTIEVLRQYRVMQLEHQLNAKPDGCYKVIEVGETKNLTLENMLIKRAQEKKQPESVSSLKAQLKNNDDLFEAEEFKPVIEAGQKGAEELDKETEEANKKVEAEIDEKEALKQELEKEPKKVELPENIAKVKVTAGKEAGKTIGELNEKELNKVSKYGKGKDKEAATKALEILFPSK